MSRRGIGAGTNSGSIGPGGSARAAARRSGACACPGRSRTGSGPALRDIDDDGGRFEVDEKGMECRAGEVGQRKDQVA